MKKIKILEVIRDAEGGMKKHVQTLISGLDKDRFDIFLACSKEQFDHKDLEKTLKKVYEISLGDRRSVLAIISSLILLIRIIKSEGIEVVHAHGMASCVLCTIAGFFAGKTTVITTIHNFPTSKGRGIKQRLTCLLCGFLLKSNHRVFTVSQNLGKYIYNCWHIPEEKIQVIYNGIDTGNIESSRGNAQFEVHAPNEAKPVIVLNIARLIPSKGIDVFLKATSILLGEINSADNGQKSRKAMTPKSPLYPLFLIAGSGPQESELKKMAHALGIEKYVRFLGFRDDIYDLIRCSDMVVLSSRSEGLGLSLLEAMALKKPVIATEVGGIPEVITHGKTGWLVPPDCPEALAEAILHFIQDPEHADKMAKEGYDMVKEKFSKSHMLSLLENQILTLCNNP